jgi:Enoyl-CoA hydratase/isomerase
MTQRYRTLRVAPSDEGVLSVVIDAPPMNLVGPELVRDLVGLLATLESDQVTRVMVLESADPDYFVPHVDLTKVAEYTAEAAKAGGPDDASLGMLWHKLSELPVVTIAKIRAAPAERVASWRWRATCGSPRGRTRSWDRSRSAPARSRAREACSTWPACWGGAGPWRRFSARTTSTANRPNGTAGSTERCPTLNWTRSSRGSRGASRFSPPRRCDPPSVQSTS